MSEEPPRRPKLDYEPVDLLLEFSSIKRRNRRDFFLGAGAYLAALTAMMFALAAKGRISTGFWLGAWAALIVVLAAPGILLWTRHGRSHYLRGMTAATLVTGGMCGLLYPLRGNPF